MTRIIPASPVNVEWKPLGNGTGQESIESLTRAPVEACSDASRRVEVCQYHPFIQATHVAYAEHRPLALSPDMFWLLIAQGFANLVNLEPESYRDRFVRHEGKETLRIRRDGFVKGSPDNDWPGAFAEFSAQVRECIGEENHGSLVVPFSTTGPVEAAANEVVLFDTLKSFFEFEVMTVCGIPEIHLEGTAADWALLAERTANLGERYGCRVWCDAMRPWLERIRDSAAGAGDEDLWQSIYKVVDGSGGPWAQGWIVDFFSCLQGGDRLRPNPHLGDRLENVPFAGVKTDDWPGSVSLVPFRWDYLDQSFDMEFLAGFTSFTWDRETLAVRPRIGWAVRERPD